MFSCNINAQDPTAIYLQLAESIKKLISDGTLREGDLLPSETEFCEYYNISRTTVRQAFTSLEEEGLVSRIRGKGTFVATPKLNRSLNGLYSFSDEMANIGVTTDSRVLDFDRIQPSDELRNRFNLQPGEKSELFRIVRLRYVNDSPLTIETLYIPVAACPVLSKDLLEHQSLYSLLKQYSNIVPVHAVETYHAVALKKKESARLECPVGIGGFLVERLSYDVSGKLFEVASILVRGDRCKYSVDIGDKNFYFKHSVDDKLI